MKVSHVSFDLPPDFLDGVNFLKISTDLPRAKLGFVLDGSWSPSKRRLKELAQAYDKIAEARSKLRVEQPPAQFKITLKGAAAAEFLATGTSKDLTTLLTNTPIPNFYEAIQIELLNSAQIDLNTFLSRISGWEYPTVLQMKPLSIEHSTIFELTRQRNLLTIPLFEPWFDKETQTTRIPSPIPNTITGYHLDLSQTSLDNWKTFLNDADLAFKDSEEEVWFNLVYNGPFSFMLPDYISAYYSEVKPFFTYGGEM